MDAVEEIKQRLAIEDVVGQYVELKRAGRNFRGLSPFNSEKTPSFMVSPEKQIWHDFSSGKGGNIFSFVMEMEGVDFKGALELLARQAGVDLSQYRSASYSKNAKLKERLYDCLEQATKFYQLQLKQHKTALEYVLKDRALNKDTALAFKIGYSPNTGNALADYLFKKGFTTEEVKKAGLGNVFSGRMRDMFRGRVMIPLMDSNGRAIGFTARLLTDEPNAPKYINTPQTLLYDKSRHVFGLNLAKEAIRKSNFAVVVEGNMDVIASHQAGVKNVIATAGTAMTKDHLKEISRFSDDIRLSFDQDNAGQQATERTVLLASQMDVNLSVITIPSGKDPDELIQKDKKLWEKTITESTYALDWLVDYYARDIDVTTANGKKTYSNRIAAVINKLPNAIEQEHYRNLISEKLGVSLQAVTRAAGESEHKKVILKKPKRDVTVSKSDADIAKTENQYLSLLLEQPSLRAYMQVATPVMLHSEGAKGLFEAIASHPRDKARDILSFIKDVQIVADYGKVVSLLYEELYAHLEFVELENEAARLQVRVIEHFVKEQKNKITVLLQRTSDQKTVTEILEKAKKLDQLLKNARESLSGKR